MSELSRVLECEPIFLNKKLDKPDQQYQRNGRNVDSANVGNPAPENAKCRLCDPVDKIPYHVDKPVLCVNDISICQPTQDNGYNNAPLVHFEDGCDQSQNGLHGWLAEKIILLC